MTRKEVRAILGEPAKIEASGVTAEHAGPMERWFFEYALSPKEPNRSVVAAVRAADVGSPLMLRGSIEFAPPDGMVSSWIEPDWSVLPSGV
jgi:hypothetical protein